MTNNKKSTKYYSNRQENNVAKNLGGKVVSGSGASNFNKGDVRIHKDFLVECKTAITEKKSFAIKEEWLEKIQQEANIHRKQYGILSIDFGKCGNNYYVISERLLKDFLECYTLVNADTI